MCRGRFATSSSGAFTSSADQVVLEAPQCADAASKPVHFAPLGEATPFSTWVLTNATPACYSTGFGFQVSTVLSRSAWQSARMLASQSSLDT